MVVIPYVAGMIEDIRHVCRKFNIRVVFKCRQIFSSMLTKVKDTLPLGKHPKWYIASPAARFTLERTN